MNNRVNDSSQVNSESHIRANMCWSLISKHIKNVFKRKQLFSHEELRFLLMHSPQGVDEYDIELSVHDNVIFLLDLTQDHGFDYDSFSIKLAHELDFYENLFLNEWIITYLSNKEKLDLDAFIEDLIKPIKWKKDIEDFFSQIGANEKQISDVISYYEKE